MPVFFSAGRGRVVSEDNRYLKSVADLNTAIDLDPTAARAFAARGLAMEYRAKPSEALADYSQSLKLDPKQRDVWYRRARIYAGEGNWRAC